MSDEQSFLNKTEDEIKTEIFKMTLEKTGLQNLKSTGPLRGFIEILIVVISGLYSNALNSIYNRADLDRATGFWLSLWGLFLGITRKSSQKASGQLSLKTYQTGSLEKGSYITVVGTSLRYKITETFQFQTGSYLVPIEAEFVGSQYNISGGTPLSFTKVIAGVETTLLESDWLQSQGTEEEEDESYRVRIKSKWLSIGDGNPPSKFELVAGSIDGIIETKVIRCPRGQGTTDLYISSVSGEKIDSLKTEVEDNIELVGLVCRDLLVKWPEDLKRNYHFEFTGDYSDTEIDLALRAFILDIPMGGIFEERKVYLYIESLFPDLERFEIIEPTRDISASGTTEKVERIIPPSPDGSDGFTFKVVKS